MRSHLIVSHYLNQSYAHFYILGQTDPKCAPLWLLVPSSPKYCKLYWLYWFSWEIFTLYSCAEKDPLSVIVLLTGFGVVVKSVNVLTLKILFYIIRLFKVLFLVNLVPKTYREKCENLSEKTVILQNFKFKYLKNDLANFKK